MNKKCTGCGVPLQTTNVDDLGYVKNIDSNICERCFRINHYNDYKKVQKDNTDFVKILKQINETNDLVVLVVDLFNLPANFDLITNELTNDILLVLTKRDLLPKVVKDEKLSNYMEKYKLNYVDKIIISSNKNYNLDELMDTINYYQKGKNVYVVGYTNAGKSTLINKIIYNYTDLDSSITTSMLPSTTIDSINIDITSSLTLIDTPGIIESGNIVNYIEESMLKRVLPRKEVKPITYQIRGNQTVLVDNILRIDAKDTNLTFYFSGMLKIDRYYNNTAKLKELPPKIVEVNSNSDLVISGLGFIKCVKRCKLTVYLDESVKIFVRDSLI